MNMTSKIFTGKIQRLYIILKIKMIQLKKILF